MVAAPSENTYAFFANANSSKWHRPALNSEVALRTSSIGRRRTTCNSPLLICAACGRTRRGVQDAARSNRSIAFDEKALPGERMADDAVEIIVARLPAKNTPDAIGLCHERCGIARPPRAHMHGEVLVRCALDRRDHRRAPRNRDRSRNSKPRSLRLAQKVERGEMCISEIDTWM